MMEMSVREARAQFAHALSAAEKGERVTITKNGKPIAEIGPPTKPKKFDWDRLEESRHKLGIEAAVYPLDEKWRQEFDDSKWTREIFGPEYFDDEPESK